MFVKSSTLALLRPFEAAARLLSFKRAALELHVTQGAVSQQIKHLEQALGCKLFYRLTRRVELTDEGRRFAKVVQRALDGVEQEAKAIAAWGAATDIRIRVAPSFALRWLVPRLGSLYGRNPDIRLFIIGAYGHFDPAAREFDLAIEMGRGSFVDLHSEVLLEESLIPVCSPIYLARHAFLKKPKDLALCTLLHDGHAPLGTGKDAEWRHWLHEVGAGEVDSTAGQFFSLAHMALEAALAHQGVAMARAALIKDLLDSGQLVIPFKQWIKIPLKYYVVYPRELADRPAIQAVVLWLREEAVAFERCNMPRQMLQVSGSPR